MVRALLDTNVVSFVFKGHPLAAAYKPFIAVRVLAISFMTVAELYEGGYRAGWNDARWSRLKQMLKNYTILDSTESICETWAWIRSERKGNPIAGDDAWIAATALAYDCSLVTHNPNDFDGIRGLKILTAVR